MKNLIKGFLVVLNFLLNSALGVLIVGGFVGVNQWFWVSMAAFLFGFAGAWLWIKIFGKKTQLKKFFFMGQALIIVFLGATALVQSCIYTNQPMLSQNRVIGFERLWSAIDRAYPYFEEKEIDWDAVYDIYAPQIRETKTDGEYYELISSMMTHLEDAHSQLQVPQISPDLFGTLKSIGGITVVDLVGYSAGTAGLEPGMIVVAVEGIEIEQYLKQMPIGVDNAASESAVRIRKLAQVLAVPQDESALDLTVINANGEIREIRILKLDPPSHHTSQPFQDDEAVSCKLLDNNIGYIRLNRLSNKSGEDLVADFDMALDSLMQTRGLILDLRENGGGNSMYGDQIAGRFLSDPFLYGRESYPVRLFLRGWRKTTTYTVFPRGETYQGKLVLLTDSYTMSSAEWLVGALKDSGRAITVGRTTSGSTGNPIRFKLPGGGIVRYSTGSFTRPDGNLVEGFGYEPDIHVVWTVEEYLPGADVDIMTAMAWFDH